jgi:hypothetical protein
MDCNSEPLVVSKRQKVRSAWISFAGRIAAQLIGAVATVGLGVVVFSHRAAPATAAMVPATTQPSVLVAKPVRTQQGTVIVLVPLDRYNEVTAETVEKVSRALATDLSQPADDLALSLNPSDSPVVGQTPSTPRWAAANVH